MRVSFTKILIAFILIIILPTAFYSIYELSTYRKYEKTIEDIYGNQLRAILSSVNQNAEEILNEWANRIGKSVKIEVTNDREIINELVKNAPSVDMIFLSWGNEIKVLNSRLDSVQPITRSIQDTLNARREEVEKLKQYYENGYRKLQPISFPSDRLLIYFINEISSNLKIINGMVIDANQFINQTLDPRIQQISRDKFYIGIFDKNRNQQIYNTERGAEMEDVKYTKDLWLFPDYYAAIELKEMKISSLIKERSRRNILFILLVDLLLIIGVVLVFRSIHKQIRLAQLKSEFVSNVSHEIRTPLSLIHMYVESLKMGRIRNKEKEKEYLEVVLKETRRLSGMVNKILNFSQIEKGKRKYHFEQLNLNEVVDEVLSTYSHHLEKKQFNHQIHLDQHIPSVMADREAVSDAVVNLMDNAIKYSSEEKYVEINTGMSNGSVFLEVKDRGKGISEKEMKYIFDKFYRATGTDLTPNAKGSGLGLSIVKHIMDAHNGSIRVDSKQQRGSSFLLYFPAYD